VTPLSSDDRPWGRVSVTDRGDGFEVKRLEVHPGKRLSLQAHRWRSEHWYVTQGIATAQVGDVELELAPGSSIDIALGQRHRLTNRGDTVVVVIEVGRGDYLGEDDIERFDDDFGR